MHKNGNYPQAVFMKVKVYETEIRNRDEREIRHPDFDKKKGAGI